MTRQWIGRLAGVLLAVVLAAWGVGEAVYPSKNPPHRDTGTILSAQSDQVLRQACFDCHSNETRHPWYRHMPMAALLMSIDIRQARHELNFSNWDRLDAKDKRKSLARALHEIRDGDMPELPYWLMHPQARLNAEQVAQLEHDARTQYGVQPGTAPRTERD